jgi:hypothetical protein
MSFKATNGFRVDFRPAGASEFVEWTGRAESLSATSCTIATRLHPSVNVPLELRLYLPGTHWPLRVDQAEVTWGNWDSITVEFMDLPLQDRERLCQYLLEQKHMAAA